MNAFVNISLSMSYPGFLFVVMAHLSRATTFVLFFFILTSVKGSLCHHFMLKIIASHQAQLASCLKSQILVFYHPSFGSSWTLVESDILFTCSKSISHFLTLINNLSLEKKKQKCPLIDCGCEFHWRTWNQNGVFFLFVRLNVDDKVNCWKFQLLLSFFFFTQNDPPYLSSLFVFLYFLLISSLSFSSFFLLIACLQIAFEVSLSVT